MTIMSNSEESSGLAEAARAGTDRLPLSASAPLSPSAGHNPSAVSDLMQRVAQGAHESVDRLADGAAPVVAQLNEGLAGAEEALQAQTDQVRETGKRWAQSLRNSVRSQPLLTVVGALALGALVAHVARRD